MMQSFEEIPEVSQFSQTSITKSSIDEGTLLRAIEQNFPHFIAMQTSQNGYLAKLAFISSILRFHNLKCLNVKQSFDGVLFGSVEDKFSCTLVAEPYNSEQMPYKEKVLEHFEQLKDECTKEGREEESSGLGLANWELLKVQTICSQKSKVKELYNKILIQLSGNSDAAIALTSFLIFEMEMLSVYANKRLFLFFDLYELANPLDKWFASVHIEGTKSKPIICRKDIRMQ